MSKSDYLDYLEESTNTVKSRTRLSIIILIAVYLGIWAASLISFWFFNSGSDAMGYSILYLWILLPVTTFVISLIIGKNNYWGGRKWLLTIAFGFLYMLAEYGTFSAANMITFHKINFGISNDPPRRGHSLDGNGDRSRHQTLGFTENNFTLMGESA